MNTEYIIEDLQDITEGFMELCKNLMERVDGDLTFENKSFEELSEQFDVIRDKIPETLDLLRCHY